jgi:hypothetical protein
MTYWRWARVAGLTQDSEGMTAAIRDTRTGATETVPADPFAVGDRGEWRMKMEGRENSGVAVNGALFASRT